MVKEIVQPITQIVYLSIQQSIFLSLYKRAKVIPLFKRGNPLDTKDYRSVVILCIMCNVIEKGHLYAIC